MIDKIIDIVREASKLMTADITIEQKGNDSRKHISWGRRRRADN